MQVELAVQTHLEMQVELAVQAQLEVEVQLRRAGPGAGCCCGMNAISSICQRPTGCEMVRSISAYLAG